MASISKQYIHSQSYDGTLIENHTCRQDIRLYSFDDLKWPWPWL